jgi:hypothetical protein
MRPPGMVDAQEDELRSCANMTSIYDFNSDNISKSAAKRLDLLLTATSVSGTGDADRRIALDDIHADVEFRAIVRPPRKSGGQGR